MFAAFWIRCVDAKLRRCHVRCLRPQAPPEALEKLQDLVQNSGPDGPRILMTSEKRVPLFKGQTEIKVRGRQIPKPY